MTNPVRAQGAEAKKLGLSEFDNPYGPGDNPYGPGDNHDAWRAGFGVGKDTTEEPVVAGVTQPQDGVKQTRKGSRKADAKAVVKPTGTGETALTTTVETADPQNNDGPGAEVTVGDPSASTLAAQTGGDGQNLSPPND